VIGTYCNRSSKLLGNKVWRVPILNRIWSNTKSLLFTQQSLNDKFQFMEENNRDQKAVFGIGALLLLLESVLVLALGLYMIALGFTHDKAWLPYLSVTGFAFVGSAALFALARGVKDGKRWANSPAILANLIALGVAKYQFEAGAYWLAIPITIMSITVVVGLLKNIKKLAS
jgi:protein-S-isoprenylcysteine O-methyltransferase Ste14